jgi:hypothetical protein
MHHVYTRPKLTQQQGSKSIISRVLILTPWLHYDPIILTLPVWEGRRTVSVGGCGHMRNVTNMTVDNNSLSRVSRPRRWQARAS